jgi:endonuclease G
MKNVIFLFLISVFTISAQHRTEIHTKHWIFGYPYGAPESNDLIIRDYYALSSNDSTKFADWVAYKIDRIQIEGRSGSRNWKPDPWLADEETLEPDDYKSAHAQIKTDRGHQAALADFSGTPFDYETNYLSNITPQSSDLNQGPWRFLEESSRDLLDTFTVAWIMTGPLYEEEFAILPEADEAHKIPSGYWKIIAVPVNDTTLAIAAFIMNQDTPRGADFLDYIVTVDEVERRSGLDFFWEMVDEIEERLESDDNSEWIRENF